MRLRQSATRMDDAPSGSEIEEYKREDPNARKRSRDEVKESGLGTDEQRAWFERRYEELEVD